MTNAFNPTFTDLIDDFETFLRYFEKKPNLLLTGAGDLKAADLWALNERVSFKAPAYVTPKSRVADYPLLGFLFQVVRSAGCIPFRSGKSIR